MPWGTSSQTIVTSIDTIVMGRKTYDVALAFGSWPYAEKRCIVVTHSPCCASRRGILLRRHHEARERLDAEGSKRVYVDGGALVAQFFAANLIEDVTISVLPILLGEGTPIAPKIGHDVRLRLEEHRAFESGLVQLSYRVVK